MITLCGVTAGRMAIYAMDMAMDMHLIWHRGGPCLSVLRGEL